LKQFYHIPKASANAILEHWTQRQADGKVPLKFKKAAKVIRERQRTSGEDSDNDAGSGKEAEEEPRSDDDGHSDGASAEDGRGRPSSARQERSPNGKVRNLDIFFGFEV